MVLHLSGTIQLQLTCVWRAERSASERRLRFCAKQAIIFIVYAGTVFNAIHLPPPFYIHPCDFSFLTITLNSKALVALVN